MPLNFSGSLLSILFLLLDCDELFDKVSISIILFVFIKLKNFRNDQII